MRPCGLLKDGKKPPNQSCKALPYSKGFVKEATRIQCDV